MSLPMDTLITFNIKYPGDNIIYDYLSEYLDKNTGAYGHWMCMIWSELQLASQMALQLI